MKNVYLYLTLCMLIGLKSFGQADVIIWVDNSSSITTEEFADMRESIQKIIHNVLTCNDNRVAVVHYGALYPTPDVNLFIESDFTNDEALANSFVRHRELGTSDYAHEALALIGKALDNITDAHIVSTQKTLNHLSTKALVVYLITDADRSYTDSYLVNHLYHAEGDDRAFENYTSFKLDREAKFVVTAVPHWEVGTTLYNLALKAAAAIATLGGSYVGPVESFPADPDGPGVTGRYYTNTGFILTEPELMEVSSYICSLSGLDCVYYITLVSPTDNVSGGIDNQQAFYNVTASNVISSGAEANYYAGTSVDLQDGFYAGTGSLFLARINECEEDDSGVSRMAGTEQNEQEESLQKTGILKLFPNPATGNVTLTLIDNIKTITVTSLDGKTIFSKDLSGEDTAYQLDLNNYKSGMYFITAVSQTGQITTERLIVK